MKGKKVASVQCPSQIDQVKKSNEKSEINTWESNKKKGLSIDFYKKVI